MVYCYVLINCYIWLLCGFYLLVYVVRIGINDWGLFYLVEWYVYNIFSVNSVVVMFEVGGFLGLLFGGWGFDYYFCGNCVLMNLIFVLGIFVFVVVLWLIFIDYLWFLVGCFFCIGFFVFGL